MMRIQNKIDHTIYPDHPQTPTHVGTFEENVEVNGKQRKYLMYIPSDVRAACAGIFVLPDSRISAREMLEKSNWADLAETDERKEKFIVYFLEADDKWNLMDPAEELAYVHAVYVSARLRDKCIIHESKCYLAGYGDGGTIAQLSAMDYPAIYAGVVSAGAPEPSKETVEAIGNEPCLDLDGYEDPDWKYGYHKKDFLVPSWIITSGVFASCTKTPVPSGLSGIRHLVENSIMASYWRKAGKTDDTPHMLRPDTLEYRREISADWTVNQEKEAFRVWVSLIPEADRDYGNAINRRIWSEFLWGVRRWMAEPGGDLRVTKDPVLDLDMEYHYEEIDGWMREYYVHVPESVKKNPHKPVPLVFAIHGYTCSGEIYVGNSEWYKVANDYGFIAVFPSAVHGYLRFSRNNIAMILDNETELPAWNLFDEASPAPDELVFFEEMLRRISEKHAVDKARVFATGHSMGSLMVQYLGMAKPELFAAIAPCSGILFADADKIFPEKKEVKNRKDKPLPIWMFGGENEEWLLDSLPLVENETGQTIQFWWEMNHMDGEKPVDFEAYRQDRGRWKDYIFEKDGKPMIRYTWVEEMPHATMTEMSYRIWEEFFSKF